MTGKVPGGRELFRFAVLADTHIEPERSEGPEPRSNARTRAVVRAINRRGYALALHLGDVVHPVPAAPEHEPAVEKAKEILSGLEPPLHLTAGNHDIGDKPIAWMPAKTVREEWTRRFGGRYGPSWSSFAHGGCRFVLLNAPLLNSGTALETEQKAWLEALLVRHAGERLFLFAHYPPYLLRPDERSHYDNIDEPARSWLLGLVECHRPEALFTAHVHNLFYDRIGNSEHYVAPSTSFVRRDYSELFRIAPEVEHEFGRNDEEKLGFFEVVISERGHKVSFRSAQDLHDSAPCPVGVELRHPWCEITELPFNPPTDALQRRKVRNDHPLWALWQLGIDRVRTPLQDVLSPRTHERMWIMHQRGSRFTVFTYGVPTLDGLPEAVDALELVLELDTLDQQLASVASLRQRCDAPILLAPLSTSQATSPGMPGLPQFVGQGFALATLDDVRRLFASPDVRAAFDGLCITLTLEEAPGRGIAAAADLARSLGLRVHLTLSLMPATPDQANLDDALICARILETRDAALAHRDVHVFLDTFMSIDRGYYVRGGLIDRRGNLTPAARVLL
ncbi:MAG: metallophosphoesterase [Pseudomonadota bacterium]